MPKNNLKTWNFLQNPWLYAITAISVFCVHFSSSAASVHFSSSAAFIACILNWVCTAVMSNDVLKDLRITLSGMMDPLKLTCSQQLWLHSSAPVSQRSRVRIPLKPEFFFRLLFRICLNCVSTAKIFHNVITHNRGTNPVTIMLYYPLWHDGPTKIDLLPTVMAS